MRSLGRLPNICFVALLLLGLAAFLPTVWLPPAQWRLALANFGIPLPQTRSPQPWLTLQSALLFTLGSAWAYYLLAQSWSRPIREKVWTAYVIGVLVLASALIVCFVTKQRIPFWPEVHEYGFFPNRNQTSNVLGIAGIVIYALALQRLQEHRKYWWTWIVTLTLICWALIIDTSRAGIILFFFGALAVHIYWWWQAREQSRPIAAFGPLILLIALFLVDGGATLARFGKEMTTFFSLAQNFRFLIYRDAIHLILRSSPFGIGLGNFPAIFPIYRQTSLADNDLIHPESDWLWAGIELGWLAPLLLLVLFIWWFRQCLPLETKTSRLLRAAAMIGGCAFAIHGIFDVSGHRLGTLWPALFLVATALHPNRDYRSSIVIARLFQILGLLLVCVGIWWLVSTIRPAMLPTSATRDQLEKKISHASDHDNYTTVVDLSSEALRIAPLEWSLYYKRGAAEAALFRTRFAEGDFGIARHLMPYWPELWFDEGRVWVEARKPDLGFDLWAEALERWPERAGSLYADMFGVIRSESDLVDRWRELGRTNKKCLLVFLQNAAQFEFQIELQQLLADDPELRTFTQGELKALLTFWYKKGDKLWLAETLQQRPEWKKIAWRQLAHVYADYQDYRQAFETADQFLPQANVAASSSPSESSVELALRFRSNPGDSGAGEALALALAREGKIDGALSTLRAMRDLPGRPEYLPALEARLWAKKQEWKRAWNAVAPLVSGRE